MGCCQTAGKGPRRDARWPPGGGHRRAILEGFLRLTGGLGVGEYSVDVTSGHITPNDPQHRVAHEV